MAETHIHRRQFVKGMSALSAFGAAGMATAQSALASGEFMDPGIREQANAAADRGLAFIRQSREDNGSWLGSVGITALALRAILTSHNGYTEADADLVAKPVEFLLANVKPDGSITESIQNRNYNTATALAAFARLNSPKYADVVSGAQKFIVDLQLEESKEYSPDHKFYGGIGYGGDERPDLSNMHYALEALSTTGLDRNDPVFKRALVFVSRSQNNSETNDQAWAGNDGGFTYMPDKSPHAGTASYGGMTHAGLISLIYAGVDRSDPRIQAAYRWIQENYTVERNPGTESDQGLFYYYTAFAKAMTAMGASTIVDADGQEHNWRNDLAAKLVSIQGEDGAWVNTSPRWWEGLKPLVTARAVIALNLATTA